ncbi:hypothetical protein B0H13DRAFT_2572638 [Mycena leptocephala]|nr:hypothetical protein B0H13DRAFT_2572638 [Mycena leptocephala]
MAKCPLEFKCCCCGCIDYTASTTNWEGLLLSSESLLGDPGALADTLAAIPPLQHGDLQALGLCHWTPAGLMQYSFELVHVSPDAQLCAPTASDRGPESEDRGDQSRAAYRRHGRDAARQPRSGQAQGRRGRVDAWLVAPMIQIPISIGMFFGVKKMCELPVMQLTQSGFEWLPDLTQPGPYFICPFLSRRLERDDVGPPPLPLSDQCECGPAKRNLPRPRFRTALKIPQWTPPPAGSPKLPTMRESIRYFIDSAKPGQQGQRQAPGRPALHSPHPSLCFCRCLCALKSSARPVRPLEVVARQAQARASASPKSSSGGLFEDPEPPKPAPKPKQAAPAPPPTSKPKQAPLPPAHIQAQTGGPCPTPKSTPPKSKAAKRPKS